MCLSELTPRIQKYTEYSSQLRTTAVFLRVEVCVGVQHNMRVFRPLVECTENYIIETAVSAIDLSLVLY